MKIVTYRYLWTVSSMKDKVSVKILSDVEEGHNRFIEYVQKNIGDLEKFGREYVCEYDLESLSRFEDLLNGVKEISEAEKEKLVSEVE